jgi:hypothetical protein
LLAPVAVLPHPFEHFASNPLFGITPKKICLYPEPNNAAAVLSMRVA